MKDVSRGTKASLKTEPAVLFLCASVQTKPNKNPKSSYLFGILGGPPEQSRKHSHELHSWKDSSWAVERVSCKTGRHINRSEKPREGHCLTTEKVWESYRKEEL